LFSDDQQTLISNIVTHEAHLARAVEIQKQFEAQPVYISMLEKNDIRGDKTTPSQKITSLRPGDFVLGLASAR
jgi:hypothetical protein